MLQLILSLLAISGIGALLALLLEIAGAYIANYGDSRIRINDEKNIVVKGGNPLLFSLMEKSIFIPSACGGKGTCSLCKLKVQEGGGPLLPTETPYLSKEEIEENVRLSCQVKVRNDIKIEIPEELFLVREFDARVDRIDTLTPDIKGIRFKLLRPEEGISLKAGQYVQLEVPKYKLTKEPEYRAYSVASSADDQKELDLVVTRVPDGAVSTYVHDYLKVGAELRIIGPYGEFYLRDSERDIFLIATGSGLSPIMSILHQIDKEKRPQKTTLFFGAKTREHLFFEKELAEFENKIPHFKFVPTLSRSTEVDQWSGEKGRVTDLIQKHISDDAAVDVYICGSPTMVESCVDLLGEKGIPEENIFFDKFE